MEHKLPTIEECLATIRELNKENNETEENLKHKANWLYMLNRLKFWDDMPILIELIQYEIKHKSK
jgi:hypothetical protein